MYTMLLIHIFNRTDSKFARKRKKKKIWDTKEIRSSCLDDGGRDCKHLALMNLCSVVNGWSSGALMKTDSTHIRLLSCVYTFYATPVLHPCRLLPALPLTISHVEIWKEIGIGIPYFGHRATSKRDACRLQHAVTFMDDEMIRRLVQRNTFLSGCNNGEEEGGKAEDRDIFFPFLIFSHVTFLLRFIRTRCSSRAREFSPCALYLGLLYLRCPFLFPHRVSVVGRAVWTVNARSESAYETHQLALQAETDERNFTRRDRVFGFFSSQRNSSYPILSGVKSPFLFRDEISATK